MALRPLKFVPDICKQKLLNISENDKITPKQVYTIFSPVLTIHSNKYNVKVKIQQIILKMLKKIMKLSQQ